MTRTTKNPARHTSAQAEALIQAFLNPDLQIGPLEERAQRLLSSDHLIRIFGRMMPKDQEKIIDKLNQVHAIVSAQDKRFLVQFGIFCGAIGQLPPSAVLSTELVMRDNVLVAHGGLTDVLRGEYRGIQVAVKAFRAYSAQNLEEAKQILWRLVPVWVKFSHPNIVTFRGVTTTLFPLALVYDWGEKDTIMKYTRSHPETPRLTLLLQVARGLQYLHSLDIPHGNLRESNVVVDKSGNARLTDYGLALVNANPELTVASPDVGKSRWLAPEIINPPPDPIIPAVESKSADIFALGMLGVAVFTGKLPFEECSDVGAASRISEGGRPERPRDTGDTELTPEIWQLFERCWDHDPRRRLTIEEVVKRCEDLLGIYGESQSTSPPIGTGRQVPGHNPRQPKKWRRWLCLG